MTAVQFPRGSRRRKDSVTTEHWLAVIAVLSVVPTVVALIWLGSVYLALVDSRRYLREVFGTYPLDKATAMCEIIMRARLLQQLFEQQQYLSERAWKEGAPAKLASLAQEIPNLKREFWKLRDALQMDGYRLPKTVQGVAELTY